MATGAKYTAETFFDTKDIKDFFNSLKKDIKEVGTEVDKISKKKTTNGTDYQAINKLIAEQMELQKKLKKITIEKNKVDKQAERDSQIAHKKNLLKLKEEQQAADIRTKEHKANLDKRFAHEKQFEKGQNQK